MNNKAMYKLSYGLFILTARDGDKDNGCIINTAIQAASTPNQISVCVNKANYTHDMIKKTGELQYLLLVKKHPLNYSNILDFSLGGMLTNLMVSLLLRGVKIISFI